MDSPHRGGRARGSATLLLALLLSAAGSGALAADIELSVVSTRPERPHLVAAGSETTFVIEVRNLGPVERSVQLSIESDAGEPWAASLSLADDLFQPVGVSVETLTITVPMSDSRQILAHLGPPASAAEESRAEATVSATLGGVFESATTVRAKVRNKSKVYYVAIDGLGPRYLALNRKGAAYEGKGERLMPRANEFLQTAAYFSSARSLLPASTDVDHTSALSGSWTGTLGIPSIRRYYAGTKRNGNAAFLTVDKDLLRFGPTGEPVRTIYDVSKDSAAGGSPDIFSVFLSGKEWVGELYEDSEATVDIIAGGRFHPDYIPPPHAFKMGDPESDPDAAIDREGTNVSRSPRIHKRFSRKARLLGRRPEAFPEDRWIVEAAIRMIAAEDPDVMYLILAECDTSQHTFGAADRPHEWIDPGTPDVLWDDTNVYNPMANRDPVLDIVYEADASFGLLVDSLASRGTLDRSYVVLLSDHSQITAMEEPLPVGPTLLQMGVQEDEVDYMLSRHSVTFLYLADPGRATSIAAMLEAHEVFHPVLKELVRPFIVFDATELDSGIDNLQRGSMEDGILGNRRGEFYSEWGIDFPAADASKVRWPHIVVFNRYRYQNVLIGTQELGGGFRGPSTIGTHAAPESAPIPLALRGPGILAGIYKEAVTLADVAPTLYHLLDLDAPGNVDGTVLEQIFPAPSEASESSSQRFRRRRRERR